MRFLKLIGSSIHSPQFYSTLSKKSFKQSLGYFLLLALLLTLIHTTTLIMPFFREAPEIIKNYAQQTMDCFPQDLEVKVLDGEVSINKEEPFFISSCEGGGYLGVIDTKTPYSKEKFDAYRVGLWVTKDSIAYKKNELETTTYSLGEVKDFKLTKDVAKTYKEKFEPYLKFIGPILLLLSFIGIYLSYLLRLIHLLIVALIIWLLFKVFKRDLNYSSSYKVSLYAITLGLIVSTIVDLTVRWTHFTGFPFMVTILTLAVVFVNLLQPKKNS